MLTSEQRQELEVCPALVVVLESGRVPVRGGGTAELHSASTVNNLVTLKRLFASLKATRTLETGLGFGASCVLLAALHQATGSAPQRQHMAIDPFQSTDWQDAASVWLDQASLSGYAEIIRQKSAFVLPELCLARREFDLIYLDGSHLFEDVFLDFFFSRFLLREGGVVLFDDCVIPHVAKVLRFIRTNLQGEFRELDLSPYRSDLGHPLKYRLARTLGRIQLRAFEKIGDSERHIASPFAAF